MKRNKKEESELNQRPISLLMFLESYNQNLPVDFPRASVEILEKFRITHPMLFKRGAMWAIDLHRKRVIDWLSAYREI